MSAYGGTPYIGVRIVESPHLTDTVEDWSGVRSPSRAMRRRRQGHRQNIKIKLVPKSGALQVGNTIYVHPELADRLRRDLQASMNRLADETIMGNRLF